MNAAVFILALVALASAAPKVKQLGFRNLYKEPIAPVVAAPGPKIIGGHEASPNSIPFQAFLEIDSGSSGWYCGGSLISANYVVTAGHCGDDADEAYVVLGAHRPQQSESTQQTDTTRSITVHPNYNSDEITNDIAVIRLSSAAQLTSAVSPASLPSASAGTFAGQTARASGWGLTNGQGSTLASSLNYVDVEVMTNNACEQIFGSLLDSILCTSGDRSTGTCSGDSGGPLAIDGVLIGVVSFGVENCPAGYPSAFTRVTSFISWLNSNTDVRIN